MERAHSQSWLTSYLAPLSGVLGPALPAEASRQPTTHNQKPQPMETSKPRPVFGDITNDVLAKALPDKVRSAPRARALWDGSKVGCAPCGPTRAPTAGGAAPALGPLRDNCGPRKARPLGVLSRRSRAP